MKDCLVVSFYNCIIGYNKIHIILVLSRIQKSISMLFVIVKIYTKIIHPSTALQHRRTCTEGVSFIKYYFNGRTNDSIWSIGCDWKELFKTKNDLKTILRI